MTAREKFKSLGFWNVVEEEYSIEYLDGDTKYGILGVKSIYIGKDGSVIAEEGSNDDYGNFSFELSKDLMTAIFMQLKEFGIELA